MKKFVTCSFLLCVIFLTPVYAQTTASQESQHTKSGQNLLFNDLYFGYGAGSIFYFTGNMSHSDKYTNRYYTINGNHTTIVDGSASSFGTLFLGYSRSLNRVVSMGFMFGFQDFSYSSKATEQLYQNYESVNGTVHTIDHNDVLVTGIARFLFTYVNKPMIRMYSGIGLGITLDFGKETLDGGTDSYSEPRIWPAGQLTLMGIRFGRALGGFFEFGFGSYSIVNAGISYKFADN